MSLYHVFDFHGYLGAVDVPRQDDSDDEREAGEAAARVKFANEVDLTTLQVQHEDWEPSDYQTMNGSRTEGGINNG